MDARHEFIFNLLANSKTPLTAKKLASTSGVSIRTIKSDIDYVGKIAETHGTKLYSKPGVGYWVEVENQSIFRDALYQMKLRGVFTNHLSDDTYQDYILVMKRIISETGYIKVDQLEHELYMSRTHILSIIKEFKDVLPQYNLKFSPNTNKGLKIEGSEFNKRILMIRLFNSYHHKMKIERDVESFDRYFVQNLEEIAKTRYILLSTLEQYSFRISDIKTQQLASYLVLQKHRNNHMLFLEMGSFNDVMLDFNSVNEISKEIFEKLKNEFKTPYYEDDVSALSLLLLSWKDLTDTDDLELYYKPIYYQLVGIVQDYIHYLEPFIPTDINLDPEVLDSWIICLAPIIINIILDQNLYYNDGFERNTLDDLGIAYSLADLFRKFAHERFDVSINMYSMDMLVKNLSVHIKLHLLGNSHKFRLLLSSGDSLYRAQTISNDILNYVDMNLIKEINTIELYEGRYIDIDDYDLFILHGLDPLFYSYSWPLYYISYENYYSDISKLTIYLQEKKDNIILRELIKSIKLDYKFIKSKKEIENLSNEYTFNSKYIIIFNPDLELNTFMLKHFKNRYTSEPNVYIEFNYIVRDTYDLYNLNLILSDLCAN